MGWFTVGVVLLSVPAALGYLQDRCGGRASEAELQKRHYHAVHRRDLQTIHLTKQEAMLEVKDLYKRLIITLKTYFIECCTHNTMSSNYFDHNHVELSRCLMFDLD